MRFMMPDELVERQKKWLCDKINLALVERHDGNPATIVRVTYIVETDEHFVWLERLVKEIGHSNPRWEIACILEGSIVMCITIKAKNPNAVFDARQIEPV